MKRTRVKRFCPNCGEEREVIKYGARNKDCRDEDQRYKCCYESCGAEFYEHAEHYSFAVKHVATKLAKSNSAPDRLIAELLGVKSHSTIRNWINHPPHIKVKCHETLALIEPFLAPFKIAKEFQEASNAVLSITTELQNAQYKIKNKKKSIATLINELENLKTERNTLEDQMAEMLANGTYQCDDYYKKGIHLGFKKDAIKAKEVEIKNLENADLRSEMTIDEIKERLEAEIQRKTDLEPQCKIEKSYIKYSPKIYDVLCKISEEMRRKLET